MTNQEVLELIDVNPVLQQQILDIIPQNLDKLSQGLFLYTKLCSILDYDDLFWASDQDGPAKERHADPKSINYINENYPYVVCYDFNIICAKLLNQIDIETEFDKQDYTKEFGNGHTDLYMLIPEQENLPKYLNLEDKVHLSGYSDMTNYKVYGDVLPILQKRVNENFKDYKTRTKQFDNLVSSITKEVIKQDNIEKKRQAEKVYNKEKVEQLVQEYNTFATENNIKLDETEKFNILFEQIGKIDLRELPALEYAKQMFSNIVKDLENGTDKYKFSIIKEKQGPQTYSLTAIMTSKGQNGNYYLKIDPPHDLKEISQQELQEKFTNGDLDYLQAYFSEKAIIPNIQSPYIDNKLINMFPMEKLQEWLENGFEIENCADYFQGYKREYAKYIKFCRERQQSLNSSQSNKQEKTNFVLENSYNKTKQNSKVQGNEYEKIY